jgi:hypothetical protein
MQTWGDDTWHDFDGSGAVSARRSGSGTTTRLIASMATTGHWLTYCAGLLAVLLVLIMVASTPASAAEPGIAAVIDAEQWDVLVWGIGLVVALLAVHVVGSWRR